jgi:endonuclease/exonuclease/phosphatase (EEP) superfamily protein YafD
MSAARSWVNWMQRVSLLALVALWSALLAGSLGGWLWWLDLFSHFRLQYAAGFAALTLLALSLRWWRHAAAGGLALLWIGFSIAPYYVAPKSAQGGTTSVRLLSYNVWSGNPQKAAVLELIRTHRPDVVALYEITPAWAWVLRELSAEYPHQLVRARPDNFGIALLSRWPLVEPREVSFVETELPSLVAEIRPGGVSMQLIATHPPPPVSARHAAIRDAQVTAIADQVINSGRTDVVVMGDLNATPWSRAFRPLLAAGLRDARRGFGLGPTWATDKPWLAVPIDHVLIGDALETVDYTVLPATGSDHRPLLVTLQLRCESSR